MTARSAATRVVAAVFTLVAGGCEVGPTYHPPRQPMPANWSAPATTQASVPVQQPLMVERWWTTFGDPELDSLVHRAVESNLSLQSATQRIREARASLGVAQAGFFPLANLNGSYNRSFSARSGSTIVTSNGAGGGVVTRSVGPKPVDLWQEGLDASWELDVFGGVRRSIEAADANIDATVEDRSDVLVTLLGEVATDYIRYRGYQEEIAIAFQNRDAQVRNAKLVREKKKLGTGTELDIVQADAIVSTTTADISTLEILEQQTAYSLSVLLALPPASLDEELAAPEPLPAPPGVVPVGLPSELLRRRPDIRRAERQLASATANIGVATADLFPKFSMTGTLSLSGSQFGALGNWNNRFWSFGPSVSWPLFDAGRIWSNIEIQNSLQAQALLTYRAAVLTALQDVQNALVAYVREQQRRDALEAAVSANQRAVVLATSRYKQGLNDFLNVLDAQRSLFASQDSLVVSRRTVGTDIVALYKALGGGWDISEPAPATQPGSHLN